MDVMASMITGESEGDDLNLVVPLCVEQVLSQFIYWSFSMEGQTLRQGLLHMLALFTRVPLTSTYFHTRGALDLFTLSADGADFRHHHVKVFLAYFNNKMTPLLGLEQML